LPPPTTQKAQREAELMPPMRPRSRARPDNVVGFDFGQPVREHLASLLRDLEQMGRSEAILIQPTLLTKESAAPRSMSWNGKPANGAPQCRSTINQ